MLSRALSLATVTLLIGCFAADPAFAQATNLEAGKSPSQIFAGTCTACHKSPRGLLKTVPAGSLQGFLRQHYTTSPEMASLLTAFLISNGATDTHYVGNQAKPGKDEKPEARSSGLVEQFDRLGRKLRPGAPAEAARPEAEPREAAKPDADGLAEPGRHGRNAKRLARPEETPAAEGQAPAQATNERGPDGRKLSAKQKLSKRGKPGGEELPKTESGKTESAKTETGKEEPAKGEAAKEDTPKSETAKVESGKADGSKPSGEAKSESAKIEPPKETGGSDTPALRPDPVPPVTPAPPTSPSVSAAVSGATPEPAAAPSEPPPAAPAAMTAATPPPVAPAGPPAPPISQ
jgi:hypothetical protein